LVNAGIHADHPSAISRFRKPGTCRYPAIKHYHAVNVRPLVYAVTRTKHRSAIGCFRKLGACRCPVII
jgi:hypothetical protein